MKTGSEFHVGIVGLGSMGMGAGTKEKNKRETKKR